MKCQRCGKETMLSSGSFLTNKEICPECQTEESKHPLFKLAKKVEREEVLKGNLNYEGLLIQYKGDSDSVVVMESIDRENSKHKSKTISNYLISHEDYFTLIFALVNNNICFREEGYAWLTNIFLKDIEDKEIKKVFSNFIKSHVPIKQPKTELSTIMETMSPKMKSLYTKFCVEYLLAENNIGPFC